MNTIYLSKTHVTNNGSIHAQVKINGNDVGLLYLTPEETDILVGSLRNGLVNSDTVLETDFFDNLYNEEDIY